MAQPKTKWWLEAAENRLWEAGIEVATIEDMPSGHGSNIRTRDGRIICVYNTGSLVCQGKLSAETKILFEEPPSSLLNASIGVPSESVESFSLSACTNQPKAPSRPLGEAYSKSRVIIIGQDDGEPTPWD